MNKQLLIEYIPFNLSPQMLKESLDTNRGRLIVRGVIQRANVKNGNGRIYPKEILEREIEKYKNTFIKEQRALGELDHSCFIDGYKILTKERGWVLFEDLRGDENVATLNIVTEEMEYQPILHVTNSPYSGDIINIESKTFQANVTPNHKFIVTNQYDIKKGKGLKFTQANGINKGSLIPKMSEYKMGSSDDVLIENDKGKLKIPSKTFAGFMGWYLAEGNVFKQDGHYGIVIPQKISIDNNNIENLDNIFRELSKYTKNQYTKRLKSKDEYVFYLSDPVLNIYLKEFGICDEKYIPNEIKKLNKENIQIFLDAYLSGDGTKQKNQEVYYTTSPQMALDISELINLTGFMSSVSQKELAFEEYLIEGNWIKDFDWYSKKDEFYGKIIEEKRKHYTGRTLYSIRRKYSEYYHMNDCTKTITHYDGNIHCVTVENGTILVMSPKGSTFWSGNSDSVIHLKNVSHVILNIWWEGNDVMAEIEILPTPSGNILRALIESRITVGISSRAMGSVKPLGEAVEVQDDLDLICWDFVSTPSTQGAFMEVVQESLIKPSKPIKNISKINELVTEIICNNTGFCECEFKK